MLMRFILQLIPAGLAVALPFGSTYGENKSSLTPEIYNPRVGQPLSLVEVNAGGLDERKQTTHWLRRAASSPTNDTDQSDLPFRHSPPRNRTKDPLPDRYTIVLKNTTRVSPWEHAAWATNLQKESTTNPNNYTGVPPNVPALWAGFSFSGIYWATMGDETVKRLRGDPLVASVNAVGYWGEEMSVMEAFSPDNTYMVVMDPRGGMDVWTHARTVTQRWILMNQLEDGQLFAGATDFYDDKSKLYDGFFDPETIKKIRNDENVEDAVQNAGVEFLLFDDL